MARCPIDNFRSIFNVPPVGKPVETCGLCANYNSCPSARNKRNNQRTDYSRRPQMDTTNYIGEDGTFRTKSHISSKEDSPRTAKD